MVGVLVANNTPVKNKKEVIKNKKVKVSVRHDATDSEEDDRVTDMGHTPTADMESNASKNKKQTKSDQVSKISLPQNVAYLRRCTLSVAYIISCLLPYYLDLSDTPRVTGKDHQSMMR